MEHELALLSPEKTILTYRLASIAGRVFAHLLDVLIIIAVIVIVGFGVGLSGVLGEGAMLLSSTAYLVFIVAFPFLYFILFEAFWNGQTLGKKAMTLRVRMADGTAITPLAAIGRNLLRPADLMPGTYFVGLLAMFTTPRSQRLGDLISN
ncbi:MAG TPA: RDD family protein, partial [Fimbriimonadaceae bacterium]|nr:RDD family protein [Fimbriimonadaceae bacterium]